MKKWIATLMALTTIAISLSCFAVTYASESITSAVQECSQVSIYGINTEISKNVDEEITDTVTLSPAEHSSLCLQQFDEEANEWVTRKKYVPSSGTIKITYPDNWKQRLMTRWRLYVPANDYHTSYVSQEITISSINIQKMKFNSKAVAIIDCDTGMLLYDKNANKELPMASTTKVMTALLTFENCNLDDKVNISYDAAMAEYGCLLMRRNDKYYVKDLLYALMLPSSNDAAIALATHIQPNVPFFSKMMNDRAKELGLEHTHFVNPNGLHDPNHYSTAYDMSVIHSQLMGYEDYFKICRTPEYTVKNTKGKRDVHIKNTDKLLPRYPNILSGKTGFTTPAGYCFTCAYEYKGKIYIFTTLGSKTGKGRWQDCDKLIKYIETYA